MMRRFDSRFWSDDTIATLTRLALRYPMAVRTNTDRIAAAIAAINKTTRVAIDYTPDGQAQKLPNAETRISDWSRAACVCHLPARAC